MILTFMEKTFSTAKNLTENLCFDLSEPDLHRCFLGKTKQKVAPGKHLIVVWSALNNHINSEVYFPGWKVRVVAAQTDPPSGLEISSKRIITNKVLFS